jgi:hypothetical protein
MRRAVQNIRHLRRGQELAVNPFQIVQRHINHPFA